MDNVVRNILLNLLYPLSVFLKIFLQKQNYALKFFHLTLHVVKASIGASNLLSLGMNYVKIELDKLFNRY